METSKTEQELFGLIILAAHLYAEEETTYLGALYGGLDAEIRKALDPHPFKGRVNGDLLYQSLYLDEFSPGAPYYLSQVESKELTFKEDETLRDVRWRHTVETLPSYGLCINLEKSTPSENIIFDFNSNWREWLSEGDRRQRIFQAPPLFDEDWQTWCLQLLFGNEDRGLVCQDVLVWWPADEKFPIHSSII